MKGLCLSGGGIKAAAHIGALIAIEEKGLKYISITDHDTCKSYYDLKEVNISEYYSGKIVNGVELKCIYKGRNIDVLGYKFDLDKMNNWLKEFYKENLHAVRENIFLFDMIRNLRQSYHIALVTTASRKNTEEILQFTQKGSLFELVYGKTVNFLFM